MDVLRPFQKQFLRHALAPGVDTAALSIPRGNGKSWLAAHLLTRVLTPSDKLFVPGTESVLGAASIEQSRIVFRFVRDALEPTGEYRFLDSATRIGVTHKASHTRLRVISSNGKTAMGLVNTPYCIMDEPGSYETVGGQLMFDAIQTAQGKPFSPLKAIYIGTLAPAVGGWWHNLIADGSRSSTYVQSLQGDPDKWDKWPEIRRCNPLVSVSADFRKKLLEERDAARADTRLKARFLSYRLNIPTGDESSVLLTTDDYKLVTARDVPEREGRPILAIDLGAGRAWSAAVAMWRNGRCEAMALAPGIPSVDAQERRDRVPTGTYARLVSEGKLLIARGLRVQPPRQLIDAAYQTWGKPVSIISDRFQLTYLQDCARGVSLTPRVTRWSEATEDIKALRKMAVDGPLTVDRDSRLLIAASLSAAMVKNDDAGNTRLVKRGSNNQARDDVAAALTLAAGAYVRAEIKTTRKWTYRGAA